MGANDKNVSGLATATPVAADYLLFWDISQSGDVKSRKCTFTTLGTVLEAIISHDNLVDYSVDQHRTINDSGSGVTDLWSASKISSEIAAIDLSSYLNKDGSVALTADWDLGDGRAIELDTIKDRSDYGGLTITMQSNPSGNGGDITLTGVISNGNGSNINLTAGAGTSDGGNVSITSGDGANQTGNVTIKSSNYISQGAIITGAVSLSSGDNGYYDTGALSIFTGDAGGGDSGNITIQTGTATGTRGTITLNAAADDVLLANQPTGGTDLAVATTKYVDDNAGISDVVDDTTPQLGGDLDLNGNNIDFPTTANISDCLDEDNMSSDSATALATQQSIKAYADTKMTDVVDDTTPQLGGELDCNGENINMKKTGSVKYELPTADNTWTAESEITATVDTNSVGLFSLLEMASDGNFDEADADAEATSDGLLALALETGTGSKRVMLRGFAYDSAWSWNVGEPLFISTTVGTMTQTAPSGSGDIVRKVGIAMSANLIYFNPSLDYTEIV